jgi:hypothetical protein
LPFNKVNFIIKTRAIIIFLYVLLALSALAGGVSEKAFKMETIQNMINLCAATIGPIIQGLKRRVNDLSCGPTVTDIVNTVAITAIRAQKKDCRS